MSKLSYKARKHLPSSDFAGPDRSYPIENESHARNALARASQHASPEVKAKIKAKVRRKFPSIQVDGEPSEHRADRSSRRRK